MTLSRRAGDLALRDCILGGDRFAGSRLLTQQLDALHDYVLHRCGRDRALTEDIVQDTMLVAIARLRDFDGRSSLFTWLCGIAKNKLREDGRRRRPVRVEDLLAEADSEIDSILAEIERTPLPEDLIEARETAELVGATLSSLPPDYRSALIEKYVEGATVPQMATRAGRGIKATESTLQRARGAFTRIFCLLAKRRGELE